MQEIDEQSRRISLTYQVHSNIHQNDFLYRYFLELQRLDPARKISPVEEYFSDGRQSAEKLAAIVAEMLPEKKSFSLLDFASGYGMVARHFAAVMPNAHVTTCDIHPEANMFNAEHLKVNVLQSTNTPDELDIRETFDVVFSLSFFSHLTYEHFPLWLKRLYSLVKKDGILVFTTHGRYTKSPVALNAEDHVYTGSSEQKDLDKAYYGTAWTAPAYVIKHICGLETEPRAMRIARYEEGFWWGHQDLFVIKKY